MNYHAECYIKELQLKPASKVRIIFEPVCGWMVERDAVKYLVLEEEAVNKEQKKALLCNEFSCIVESPCGECLLQNLLQVKLNKARVRIKVVAVSDLKTPRSLNSRFATTDDDVDFTLAEIHVI